MTVESLRLLLLGCLFAFYTLVMFYLRRRLLSLGQFTVWGLFAMLVPVLWPFWVILSRPGEPPSHTQPWRIRS